MTAFVPGLIFLDNLFYSIIFASFGKLLLLL